MGRLAAVAFGLLLAGCAAERMQGVNLLQSTEISFEQPPTRQALGNLRALGANSVAIVVFLEQEGPAATKISPSPAVTDAQLVAAIRAARSLGLRVLLKPQLLLPDDWPGAIEPQGDGGWAAWYAAYGAHLVHYARIAEAERVDVLVIGTELRKADSRPEWRRLIEALRAEYGGELSYAAHDIEGFGEFAHWDMLDSAALTLYPSLGAEPTRDAMRGYVDAMVERVKASAAAIGKPVWIAELGVQSRRGAQERPWEWQRADPDAPPDPALQADVIDLWLEALRGDWNRGVLLWAWSNDPAAGGSADRDYLLQNKPVEGVLRCHWRNRC